MEYKKCKDCEYHHVSFGEHFCNEDRKISKKILTADFLNEETMTCKLNNAVTNRKVTS